MQLHKLEPIHTASNPTDERHLAATPQRPRPVLLKPLPVLLEPHWQELCDMATD